MSNVQSLYEYIFFFHNLFIYIYIIYGPILDKDMQRSPSLKKSIPETIEKRKIKSIFFSYYRFCSQFASVLGPI